MHAKSIVAPVLVVIVLGLAGSARAQARAGGAPEDAAVTPVELQRMFDAYSIVQAQEFLKIGDDQYVKFLPRFKTLLDTRRQTLQQRTRVLNVVRRLLMDSQPDEGMLRDALKQLQEIDSRRKLELVTRARQANRLNRQQQQKLP
jgi:hypothetical protein